MNDRFGKFAVIALLVVVGVYVGQPYVDRLLFSASTPRAVEPRGNLSDLERSTIVEATGSVPACATPRDFVFPRRSSLSAAPLPIP